MRNLVLAFCVAFIYFTPLATATAAKSTVNWQPWSDAAFSKAKKEKKLVLLNMEAVWCHWCHVMDEKTYADPKVAEILKKHFITLRVDQDSRPDLSNRYAAYGWPATILFDGTGKELAKRRGFQPPGKFFTLLDEKVKKPVPEEEYEEEIANPTTSASLSEPSRQAVQKEFAELYDKKLGGWGFSHKYVDLANLEYALRRARRKDKTEEDRARATLTLNQKLIDPVWGGVYQYSAEGWDEPHFEKIMSVQAENLITYSLAYRQWKEPAHLKAIESIYGYLTTFLLDANGGFYTSQDADIIPGVHSDGYFKLDDAARRKQGIPRLDKHQYARENGWVIEALGAVYMATSDEKYLNTAKKAMAWVNANRRLGKTGGYRHDEKDAAGPYLGDALAMGRASLMLYTVTGERNWLKDSIAAMKFIEKNFKAPNGTFYTAKRTSTVIPPTSDRAENISAARYANLLHHVSGEKSFRVAAEGVMKFYSSADYLLDRPVSSLLLLDGDLSVDPTHITVVGGKADPASRTLFVGAMNFPDTYLRLEWWDKKEGPLPRNDVTYPSLPKAAAFVCTGGRCSLPIAAVERIRTTVDSFQ